MNGNCGRRYAVMYSLVGALIGFALSVVALYWLSQPLPAYVQFAQPENNIGQVCAGQVVTETQRLTVGAPGVLLVTTSFEDINEDAVPGLSHWIFFSVHNPKTIDNVSSWSVPDVVPGQYHRILGVTTVARQTRPAFRVTDFEVVECSVDGQTP